MTEPKPNGPPKPRVPASSLRSISGEQPAVPRPRAQLESKPEPTRASAPEIKRPGPPPLKRPPRRAEAAPPTPVPAPVPAPALMAEPAPEPLPTAEPLPTPLLPAAEAGKAYSDNERPTISVSKPILDMLARESAPFIENPLDLVPPAPAVPAMPDESEVGPPSPVTVAIHVAPTPASVVLDKIEDTQPAARAMRAPSEPSSKTRSTLARAGLALTAFALVAGVAGAFAWKRVSAAKLPAAQAAATMPALPAAKPVPAAQAPAAPAQAEPAPALAAAPAPAPALAPPPEPAEKAAAAVAAPDSPASLLAADGSEATAPTCETLLANVPPEADKKWGVDYVGTARKALIRGDNDGSQRSFCQAIRAGKADATVSFELAQLLLLRRDATAAVNFAQDAARLESNSLRSLTLLGDALVRAGNTEEARTTWLAAAKMPGDDRASMDRLAAANLVAADDSLKERDPARAERLLRRVIAFQPGNADAHAKMAVAMSRLGFPESAKRWAERGKELASAAPAPTP